MRAVGLATAAAVAVITGCGLATSGLMESQSTGDEGSDGGSSGSPLTDGAPASADGDTPSGGDASEDGNEGASSSSGGGDDGSADTSPGSSQDACSLPNDGGPIFTIAPWPGPPPPTIDGNLAEWPCEGWVSFTDANAAYVTNSSHPLAAQLQVRWDAQNVYVAAAVQDSSVGGDDQSDPANNDSIEIYVSGDATLDGDYDAQTHQYITDWKGLIVDYGPVHAGLPADGVHTNFTAASRTTPGGGGWTFEASIGWQALYAAGGNNKYSAGTNLALDFEVNDGDGTQQVAALVLTMAPAAGGCTCMQANCCCGETPDVPSCDSERITRVTLE